MAPAPVRKRTNNIARRRRLDDEDESKSVATELADDSQSDVSVLSDVDENGDADNSDLSEVDSAPSLTEGKTKRKPNGAPDAKPRSDVTTRRQPSPPIVRSDPSFPALQDTEMMLSGLKLADANKDAEVVDFETGHAATDAAPAVGAPRQPETLGERRRKEHEEYKKKRDADPAFIPNRGAFFMHDQRSAPAQNGFRPAGMRGRGRGGGIGGPFSPAKYVPNRNGPHVGARHTNDSVSMRPPQNEATDSPWQHDLHETVNAPGGPAQSVQPPNGPMHHVQHHHQAARAPPAPAQKPSQARNFSTTVHTHNALVRVYLPQMKAPILFQNVPIKQHTRLPNHRPPLRRDKPVRVSLPPSAPRYIFPTPERSFIFIPRALRPNQQGFGRGRGRFGSFGAGAGFSSRRTSAYGGSVYSPSVAMSRRSSMAREMGRDGLVSPAGSIMSRNGGFVDPSRPVVRLPPGGPRMSNAPSMVSPTNASSVGMVGPHAYPLPQKPTYRENWQGQLTMHQPRPQKTVSVAGIESPASMNSNHSTSKSLLTLAVLLPAQKPSPSISMAGNLLIQARCRPAHLSPIYPERAIHAPAFQPYQQAGFQPQAFVPQNYYYPPAGAQPQYMAPAGMVPMFVPGAQQPGYAMPVTAPPVTAPPPAAGQPNMVAYEQNGMTFYVDSAQLYQPPPVDGYAQPSYAVPGMGGMMTPGPDGAYYYPQQMQPQMQPTGYYPAQ
ncbi:hypothetical protein SNOG_06557 [Parastagonospora nodorum SN15]|uniref:Btz domain-containing protein n=1 Tax=Phaeosphaeria nodorum (strain SN15 / ATCC MYA-4574 / FGSC 10173) TaxID=321614 RepID=Q0UNV7_PHANO|nr:hypothetical protein SNOG_06557 [Parastagonospora nodorum SN15]EAT86388.2 hypothetical protein SNOG_06557 [Parastagonospora nodorum SN15]